MNTTKPVILLAAVVAALTLAATPPAWGEMAVVDCTGVPEGQVCDASGGVIFGRVHVRVNVGDIEAESFRIAWGVPVQPQASANGKNVTVNTGFAEEVKITTVADWSVALDGQREDAGSAGCGVTQSGCYDIVNGWTNWDDDNTPVHRDPLPDGQAHHDCRDCTGVLGTYALDLNEVEVTYTTDWLPTNWPLGATYKTGLHGQFERWYDANGDGGFDRSDPNERQVYITHNGVSQITVGDLPGPKGAWE